MRAALVSFALLALLARLFVPEGWMPVSGDGSLTIQLCTGAGPATMELPGKSGHHAPSNSCPFAGLSTHGLGTGAILFSPPVAADPTQLADRVDRALILAPGRLRPPARGPPRT
ncbi:MAG: DUF2946 family protein [Sphingomonas sp.]